jgi:hypothetical protein
VVSVTVEEDLYVALKKFAGPRGMSRFIATALREKLSKRGDSLHQEYLAAKQNRVRLKEIGEWAATDVAHNSTGGTSSELDAARSPETHRQADDSIDVRGGFEGVMPGRAQGQKSRKSEGRQE